VARTARFIGTKVRASKMNTGVVPTAPMTNPPTAEPKSPPALVIDSHVAFTESSSPSSTSVRT
jgi:hypothetical protein